MSFAAQLQNRSYQLALEIVLLCRELKSYPERQTIRYQLIKASTSAAANYRAACRGRSRNEWYAKLSITLEELDETEFWLQFINDLGLTEDLIKLGKLQTEALELTKILSKARATAKQKRNNSKLEEPFIEYLSRFSPNDFFDED
jgi:four helix bundle protein